MIGSAVLAPGYRGSVRQPIIVAIAERLEALGMATRAVALSSRSRPSPAYEEELAVLRAARDEMRTAHPGPFALVGRSFGGRMCAFLASAEPADALAIVSHPISPPGRPRPRDEEALAGMRCPTLIVQGDHDELGPLSALQRISAGNPLIDIVAVTGAGHDLTGAQEREAAEHVARWVASRFG